MTWFGMAMLLQPRQYRPILLAKILNLTGSPMPNYSVSQRELVTPNGLAGNVSVQTLPCLDDTDIHMRHQFFAQLEKLHAWDL